MSSNIKRFSANGCSECDGCAAVNKKLDHMQEMLEKQNSKICELLSQHRVLLDELLHKHNALDTVMKIFPINSESQLHELEKVLEGQKDLYVRYIKAQIKADISKNIGKILGQEIVMSFNVEGVQGKKRLKDFKNFYDAVTDAISEERPEDKFKAALHSQKQKYHRSNSKQKAKENRAQKNVDKPEEQNYNMEV